MIPLKVVALAGGTGSAKLLRGLYRLPLDLTVVANVGDNIWMYGAYVCPDVDIACYSLAGRSGPHGWGVKGDTFRALKRFSDMGLETWFRLGDQDLAVCLARTEMLRRGLTLTAATERIRASMGVRCPVLPASDRHMETRIATPSGEMHLQEFWVRERGEPRVEGVRYHGASRARPTPEAAAAIEGADLVVLCPANPVTSIGPILAVPGYETLLKRAPRVVALSPMSGSGPVSGPAGKLMAAVGRRPDSVGVAEMYARFLDTLVISDADSGMKEEIEAMGVRCVPSDTLIRRPADSVRVAKVLLRA